MTHRFQPKVITDWNDIPLVMDLETAAVIVGTSYENLKKRCLAGEFPGYKEGKLWRVEKDKLRQYMDEQCVDERYKTHKESEVSVMVNLLEKVLETIAKQKETG